MRYGVETDDKIKYRVMDYETGWSGFTVLDALRKEHAEEMAEYMNGVEYRLKALEAG
jgi:hypothetical protein